MNSVHKNKIRKLKRIIKNVSIEKLTDLKLENYFKKIKKSGHSKNDNLYPTVIGAVERALIKSTLEETSFNQLKCAQVLGINRNTLRKKIKELKIKLRKNTQN